MSLLKEVEMNSQSEDIDDVDEESYDPDPCPICTEDMNKEEQQPIFTLACGHRYCNCTGIQQWALRCRSCPICKFPIIPQFDLAEVPIVLQPEQEYKCPAKMCGKMFSGQDIRVHYANDHEIVQCSLCNKAVQIQMIKRHVAKCQLRWVQCPAGNCTEVIPYEVKQSILKEDVKTTKLSYEGREYTSAAQYLVEDHDCKHLEQCVICKRFYRDHASLAAHCAAHHPKEIDNALPSRKRKAAEICEQSMQDLTVLGKQFRDELNAIEKTIEYIPRTSSLSKSLPLPPLSPRSPPYSLMYHPQSSSSPTSPSQWASSPPSHQEERQQHSTPQTATNKRPRIVIKFKFNIDIKKLLSETSSNNDSGGSLTKQKLSKTNAYEYALKKQLLKNKN